MVASTRVRIYPPVFVDSLHAFKSLVNLDIADLPMYHTSITILLPALKQKSLRIAHYDYDFLHCLTLPLLEHLNFWGHGNPYGRDIRKVFLAVADFQRRSATSLSSLTMEDFSWEDAELFTEHLTATIGIFPDLQSLQLHRVRVDVNLLLQALTYSEGSQFLLPKLTYLGLQPYEQYPTYLSGDLKSMAFSRWWSDK
ncbi:hypothetical protein BT96DRAFT_986795 [Gymnopus androsaceus JB14]|uniref:F-box domain-containing protein n=1 Tax=Gymnopus androsaceus JB14 TaxID=1447944 RepID=A0A6A4I910_9AGAR|nr:hypothetical protein BT96DRAFT_986795 [Gymnopus androsaceus JB14]